jgi:hypothetical protein
VGLVSVIADSHFGGDIYIYIRTQPATVEPNSKSVCGNICVRIQPAGTLVKIDLKEEGITISNGRSKPYCMRSLRDALVKYLAPQNLVEIVKDFTYTEEFPSPVKGNSLESALRILGTDVFQRFPSPVKGNSLESGIQMSTKHCKRGVSIPGEGE